MRKGISSRIVGTCSKCKGPVLQDYTEFSYGPGAIVGTPYCKHCGAIKKKSYGPIIEMELPNE